MPDMNRLLLFCLWCGVFVYTVGISAAEETRLTRLDNPDYETREAATREMLADDALTPAAVAELYKQADSLEVKARLLDVARHHALRLSAKDRFNPKAPGAAGFSLQMGGPGAMATMAELGHPAIGVVSTLPGLPAYAQLQAGDLIVGVDGQLLPRDASVQGLTNLITARTTGERIELNLLREGREIAAAFRLGSLAALRSVYTTDLSDGTPHVGPEFQAAWSRTREERFAGGLRPLVLRPEAESR